MTVVVIGAGIAGLSCARALQEAGVPVRVLERAVTPGGRLGGDVVDGRPVDLGAAYLTASDPGFAAVVARWQDTGLLRPWPGDFTVYGEPPPRPGAASLGAAAPSSSAASLATGESPPSTGAAPPSFRAAAPLTGAGSAGAKGAVRWAAPRGLASLAGDLAAGLDVTCGIAVKDLTVLTGTVVLAMPAPQAAALLPTAAGLAESQDWQPSLAVALRYRRRCWKPLTGAFVNGHPMLTTLCDDGSRRGDGAPVLVAHTTPGFAIESAAGDVAAAVGKLLELPETAVTMTARRWPAARPAHPTDAAFAQVGGVYLAGDGFGRPRVEAAWLSGRAVASDIVKNQNPKTPRTASRAR